jgi:NitT/TauT family transport system substrate-binding protein
MTLRIMASRHSVFYSPLIAAISAGFLEQRGLSAQYSVLGRGQKSSELIRDGAVDIMQSAVSSNWKPMDAGESPLPVHFAQINQRDGFFLVGRDADPEFEWKKLEGRTVLADHGLQPLVMFKYAAKSSGADWRKMQLIDAGTPDEIRQAFRKGKADYAHLQAPAPQQLEADGVGHLLVSVGESMPPVAFSSLCCSRDFVRTETWRSFLEAFRQAREWVRSAPPEEVAAKEASFFPEFSIPVLAASIRRYQGVGNWQGGIEIPRDLYEQAQCVFESAGELKRRHPYEEVCLTGASQASS